MPRGNGVGVDPPQLEQATRFSQQGRWVEAIRVYGKYLETAAPDDPALAACYRGIGWCYQRLGRHRNAVLYLLKSLRHSRRNGLATEAARAYNVLAGVLFHMGCARQARTSLERMIRLTGQLGDARLSLHGHLNLARWELTHGTPAAARATLNRVRPLLTGAVELPREEVWWLILMARAEAALGQRSAALSLAHRALHQCPGFADTAYMRQEIAQLLRSLQI